MSEFANSLELPAMLVAVPLLTAVVVNLVFNRAKIIRIVSIASALLLTVWTALSSYGAQWFGGHPALFGQRLSLEFVFSPHQQSFIFIMSLVLLLVVLVSTGSLTKNKGPYIALIFLLYMSTAIILMVNDFYHLWIAVEIGSLVAAGVVAASGESVSQKAALKYTFLSAFAGSGLAIGLALILGLTGYSNISDAIAYMRTTNLGSMSSVLYVAFAFFVLTWIYAGGLAPIHPLKSEVYGAPFPHATALLQAQSKFMLVAIGLIILRVFGTLPFAKEVMIIISLITMMLGVVMALLQSDLKWVLAYLIISHSGMVTVGISLGTFGGLVGGLFQAINDVVYMSVLLLCCEALYYFGRGTSMKSLGGIAKRSPWLAVAILLGIFAASGIPPFNGFQSEIILIQTSLSLGMPEVAAVILLVSFTTFVALIRAFYSIFLRPAEQVQTGAPGLPGDSAPDQAARDPVPTMIYVSLAVLIAITLILGVYPDLATGFLRPIAQAVSVPWSL